MPEPASEGDDRLAGFELNAGVGVAQGMEAELA
jgi:hypothetical protein